MGLLRIRIKRGINLAVRDVRSSDPYVVVKMGRQVFFFFSSFPLVSSISIQDNNMRNFYRFREGFEINSII